MLQSFEALARIFFSLQSVLINWRNKNMKTQTAITTRQAPLALARLNDIMTQTGQVGYETGARHVFEDHAARKADNTISRKLHNGLFVELKVI